MEQQPVTEVQPTTQEKPNGKEEKKEEVLVKPEGEVKKEDILTSTRLAALAKREKEIVKREKNAKAMLDKASFLEKNLESIKKSPKKALQELGMTFEQFSTMFLSEIEPDGKKTAEDMIKEVVEKVDQKFSQLEEEKSKEKQEEEAKAIATFKKDLEKDVKSQGDKYELIQLNEAYDTVYEVIENYWKETFDEETGQGQYLTVEQAADQVEKYLEEQVSKFMKAKKFAKKEEPVVEVKEPTKTLTNKSVSNGFAPSENKLLTREESIRRAAKMIKFK